jgi:hypothetical protein
MTRLRLPASAKIIDRSFRFAPTCLNGLAGSERSPRPGSWHFRGRRRLVALFAAFVVFYATGLIVLWVLSPAIWGSVHCTGG